VDAPMDWGGGDRGQEGFDVQLLVHGVVCRHVGAAGCSWHDKAEGAVNRGSMVSRMPFSINKTNMFSCIMFVCKECCHAINLVFLLSNFI
jgi:hypothetical protein